MWRCPVRAAAWVVLSAPIGCDLPSAPSWDTEWIIPATSTTISLAEILPSSVSISEDGEAFLVTLDDIAVTRTLGDLCGSVCGSLQGLTARKPAISESVTSIIALPDLVVGAQVDSGQVYLRMDNGFGFDPIRPAPGVFGTLRAEVRSEGRVIATLLLDGKVVSFRSGTSIVRTLHLEPGFIGDTLDVSIHVDSPEGERIRIDTEQKMSLTVRPLSIRLSDVRISMPEDTIPVTSVSFDAGSFDPALLGRISAGALLVHLENPLPVAGDLELVIRAADRVLERRASFGGAPFEDLRMDFNADEMRSVLQAARVELQIGGVVRATADTVSLVPVNGLTMRSELIVRLRY